MLAHDLLALHLAQPRHLAPQHRHLVARKEIGENQKAVAIELLELLGAQFHGGSSVCLAARLEHKIPDPQHRDRRRPLMVTAQRNALRFCVGLAAIVPVAGGLSGAMLSLGGVSAWSADHYRYLSGLLLAIGLGFWSTIPNIERHAPRFRLLTGLVVIGGLCRLLGVVLGDPLTPPSRRRSPWNSWRRRCSASGRVRYPSRNRPSSRAACRAGRRSAGALFSSPVVQITRVSPRPGQRPDALDELLADQPTSGRWRRH